MYSQQLLTSLRSSLAFGLVAALSSHLEFGILLYSRSPNLDELPFLFESSRLWDPVYSRYRRLVKVSVNHFL